MTRVHSLSLHDALPEAAIDALHKHPGPVLLDLDETLYLGNSTEDFIDSTQPGVLALLLLRMLDIIKPWRWTGGENTRDVWRVRLVTTLFPWVTKRWQGRVAALAANFTNERLMQAVKLRDPPPIITTIGFQGIVAPLVAAMGLPEVRIVAARLTHFADRRCGKLELALGALGEETVRNGLVITDSLQDLPLLDACAMPLRTIWPQARYRRALNGVYLPGQYLTQVKRPGERYILRGILQEDFAYWVLSSIALAQIPALHFLGLMFLLLSYWSIYERGYVDNDLIGARFEKEPKLTASFHDAPVATPWLAPWGWALASGCIGIELLRWPGLMTAADLAKWMAVIGATHIWFHLYNRLDKASRVWMYAGLQFSRTSAFAILVPISIVGGITLAAHTLARWLPYYMYRLSGKDWPAAPIYLTRLLFLTILGTMLAITQGLAPFLNWTALALIGWTVFRARAEILSVLKSAARVNGKPFGPRR